MAGAGHAGTLAETARIGDPADEALDRVLVAETAERHARVRRRSGGAARCPEAGRALGVILVLANGPLGA